MIAKKCPHEGIAQSYAGNRLHAGKPPSVHAGIVSIGSGLAGIPKTAVFGWEGSRPAYEALLSHFGLWKNQ